MTPSQRLQNAIIAVRCSASCYIDIAGDTASDAALMHILNSEPVAHLMRGYVSDDACSRLLLEVYAVLCARRSYLAQTILNLSHEPFMDLIIATVAARLKMIESICITTSPRMEDAGASRITLRLACGLEVPS